MQDLNEIKQMILCADINRDQKRVAAQWMKTFIHNDPNDTATKIGKLLIAMIAKGNFNICTEGAFELSPPGNVLTVADYVSHASRVIIDYEKLSEVNRAELLAYFTKNNIDGVFARTSTHAVERENDTIKERKGLWHGIAGMVSGGNFGVNIAMGGKGQTNFIGQIISDNGYSGHLLFYHHDQQHLLMMGLEQSAPQHLIGGSPLNDSPDTQAGHDQFEQGHSLTGASDTFTAAGSLYFSNPIYQAKLLDEKNTLPPKKYGGMQVELTDQNWVEVKNFLEELTTASNKRTHDRLHNLLVSKPTTALENVPPPSSYIGLNFKSYLEQCYDVFIPEGNSVLLEKQKKLLKSITETPHADLTELVKDIEDTQDVNPRYIEAIQRIKRLHEKQQSQNLSFDDHNVIVIKNQIDELEVIFDELLMKENWHRLSLPETPPTAETLLNEFNNNNQQNLIDNESNPLDDYAKLIEKSEKILSEYERVKAKPGIEKNQSHMHNKDADADERLSLIQTLKKELDETIKINAEILNKNSEPTQQPSLFEGITRMDIIAGVALVLGATAVALALTALILGTAGMAALITGCVGAALCILGGGWLFFKHGSRDETSVGDHILEMDLSDSTTA